MSSLPICRLVWGLNGIKTFRTKQRSVNGSAQGSRLEGVNIAGEDYDTVRHRALKHKFDFLEEKAKKSEDIRLQQLEECQALKWLLNVARLRSNLQKEPSQQKKQKTDSCEASQYDAAACCNEIVSSHEVSQGSDTMGIFCFVLGGHNFSSFDSMACAITNTASATDLIFQWQLYVQILGELFLPF